MTTQIFSLFEFLQNIFIDLVLVILDITLFLLLHFLNFYILACEVRTAFFWFLNLNPYIYPWNKLTYFTQFISQFGSNFYPTFFGINIGFFINLFLVRKFFVFIHRFSNLIRQLRSTRFQYDVPSFF